MAVCLKAAWTKDMPSVKPWLSLDASRPAEEWPVEAASYDCVYNCNTIHIAPIAVLHGLVRSLNCARIFMVCVGIGRGMAR